MLFTIVNWLVTVPMEGSVVRAVIMVVEIAILAIILHGLWEFAFSLSGSFRRLKTKFREYRSDGLKTRELRVRADESA